MIGQILLQLILIALNAIFACAEIAVISSNETRIDKLAEQGSKPAKRLQALQNRPAQFLATIQVAITLSGFLGSAFAANNLANHFCYLDYHFAFFPDACFRRTCPETNCHAKGRIHCVGHLRHDSGTGKTLLAAGLAADSCHQWRVAAVPH